MKGFQNGVPLAMLVAVARSQLIGGPGGVDTGNAAYIPTTNTATSTVTEDWTDNHSVDITHNVKVYPPPRPPHGREGDEDRDGAEHDKRGWDDGVELIGGPSGIDTGNDATIPFTNDYSSTVNNAYKDDHSADIDTAANIGWVPDGEDGPEDGPVLPEFDKRGYPSPFPEIPVKPTLIGGPGGIDTGNAAAIPTTNKFSSSVTEDYTDDHSVDINDTTKIWGQPLPGHSSAGVHPPNHQDRALRQGVPETTLIGGPSGIDTGNTAVLGSTNSFDSEVNETHDDDHSVKINSDVTVTPVPRPEQEPKAHEKPAPEAPVPTPKDQHEPAPKPSAPTPKDHHEPAPKPSAPASEYHHEPAPKPSAPASEYHHEPAPKPSAPASEYHHEPAPKPSAPASEYHHEPAPKPSAPASEYHHEPAPKPSAPASEYHHEPAPKPSAPASEYHHEPVPKPSAPAPERHDEPAPRPSAPLPEDHEEPPKPTCTEPQEVVHTITLTSTATETVSAHTEYPQPPKPDHVEDHPSPAPEYPEEKPQPPRPEQSHPAPSPTKPEYPTDADPTGEAGSPTPSWPSEEDHSEEYPKEEHPDHEPGSEPEDCDQEPGSEPKHPHQEPASEPEYPDQEPGSETEDLDQEPGSETEDPDQEPGSEPEYSEAEPEHESEYPDEHTDDSPAPPHGGLARPSPAAIPYHAPIASPIAGEQVSSYAVIPVYVPHASQAPIAHGSVVVAPTPGASSSFEPRPSGASPDQFHASHGASPSPSSHRTLLFEGAAVHLSPSVGIFSAVCGVFALLAFVL